MDVGRPPVALASFKPRTACCETASEVALPGAPDPAVADLFVRPPDRGPGNPVSGFFLTDIAGMGRVGVVESLAIDILGVLRQMIADRRRQVFVRSIWHIRFSHAA